MTKSKEAIKLCVLILRYHSGKKAVKVCELKRLVIEDLFDQYFSLTTAGDDLRVT